jgi:hypothetical protein
MSANDARARASPPKRPPSRVASAPRSVAGNDRVRPRKRAAEQDDDALKHARQHEPTDRLAQPAVERRELLDHHHFSSGGLFIIGLVARRR